MTTVDDVLAQIKSEEVKFIDLRFTDTRGKEQHLSLGKEMIDTDFFEHGAMFDGSSIAGWKNISQSDMVLMPDPETAMIDPFFEETTLILRCNVVEPSTMLGYERDPRSLAKRAEQYLQATGIAEVCYVGPEPEFFILDNVNWKIEMNQVSYRIDSKEAAWNSETQYEGGNLGHRPRIKGGYFPVPPVDSSQDIRSAICLILSDLGFVIERHHHEVATGNQNEINFRFNSLLNMADQMQTFKYVVHNVADAYGKTATFMPKPIINDNGNGMHCHLSLFKNDKNLFSGDQYSGLSETALYFMGGIIKHARALNAFTNPATNSYKRLVPGFEAPVILAYSARNRSAAIRVPHVSGVKNRRIEVRFPDPAQNPYLAFSALLMAGIDGIQRAIHPGEAMDKDLYDLPPEEQTGLPFVCSSLGEALDALQEDHEFLLAGDVFTKDLIDGYVALKQEEILRLQVTTHPIEFDMYYSV